MDQSILDILRYKTGSKYLPELQHNQQGKLTSSMILDLDKYNFSLSEWNDAATYLSGIICDFKSKEEAISFLADFIS